LAAAALFLAATSRPDILSSRQEDLRRLREKLSVKKREQRETDMKAQELGQEVDRISRELRSSRRSLKEIDDRLRDTERRRTDVEDRLWASRLDIRQWGGTLSLELKRLYERRAAAEAGRFMELEWRRRLVGDKAAVLSEMKAHHAEIKASHEELTAVKAEFESLRQQREAEADRVREAGRRMTKLLATVQGRKAVLENEIQELNASTRRFEAMVQDLILEREKEREKESADRAAAEASAARRKPRERRFARGARKKAVEAPDFGKLPWPIEGAVVERFGKFKHPELDTVVVSNGVKIRPPQPGPVRSVAPGEVLYAGEFMGYGLMALVAHPDNLFTIYAHLGELRVKKGQKVSVGEALGQSGADADDRPMVYFELRLHGEAMDPLLWLR
jgi:septal ring factor EnvC (AmiA/AmiB activator)